LQIYTALGIDSRPQRVSWAVAQDVAGKCRILTAA
jgi:hypothetical protein